MMSCCRCSGKTRPRVRMSFHTSGSRACKDGGSSGRAGRVACLAASSEKDDARGADSVPPLDINDQSEIKPQRRVVRAIARRLPGRSPGQTGCVAAVTISGGLHAGGLAAARTNSRCRRRFIRIAAGPLPDERRNAVALKRVQCEAAVCATRHAPTCLHCI